jgi:multimeric flavodoxin WrbA
MNVLVINSSYRKNGNTTRIIEMVAAHMKTIASKKRVNLNFENVHIGHLDIGFCRGCRVCFDQGETKCPMKDDLLSIYEKMLASDGLILASPVYVNDVNGIMKNWIDRMAFLCHRPAFAGKQGMILTTVGLGPTKQADRTLSYALTSWGFTVVASQGFKMGARMSETQAAEHFEERIRQTSEKFFRSLETPPVPSFLSLMTFRIQQGYWWRLPADQSIDYQYWQSQGWTHPRKDYYIPHQAGNLKVTLARWVGAILAPFVT